MLVVAREHYQWISYHQSLYQNIIKMAHFTAFLNALIIGKYVWKHGGNHFKIALRDQLSSRPTCWKGCILWSCNCKETRDGRNLSQLEDRSSQPSECSQPQTQGRQAQRLLHRATATLLQAPVGCFPYPAMLNLLHESVRLLLPLPGNRWGRTLHMADPSQVPGPKLITAAFSGTFFFSDLIFGLVSLQICMFNSLHP